MESTPKSSKVMVFEAESSGTLKYAGWVCLRIGRPLLLGWRPSLLGSLEAIASRLEAIARSSLYGLLLSLVVLFLSLRLEAIPIRIGSRCWPTFPPPARGLWGIPCIKSNTASSFSRCAMYINKHSNKYIETKTFLNLLVEPERFVQFVLASVNCPLLGHLCTCCHRMMF